MSFRTLLRHIVSLGNADTFRPDAYWEDRHRTFLDSHKAVGHTGISAKQNEDQYAYKRHVILEAIARYSPPRPGRTLLDAGCGIGLLTQAYADAGFLVTGADFSGTAIARARSSVVDAEFVLTPLSTLDLHRCFDVAVLIDVLLHVVDGDEWRQTLAAVTRHLERGGVLVIVDWLTAARDTLSRHVHPRPLSLYEAEFEAMDCTIAEHTRFELPYEHSTKDLLVVTRHAS